MMFKSYETPTCRGLSAASRDQMDAADKPWHVGVALLILLIGSFALSGCVGTVLTGATLAYDRHDLYKKVNDFHLGAEINRALYTDNYLKCDGCYIDVAVFHGDVLLAGDVPNEDLKMEAERRAQKAGKYRRFFNQLIVGGHGGSHVHDSWITTKLRSKIFSDSTIDPDGFKIVTAGQVVYLLGDVQPEQAKKVIKMAQKTSGVRKVVTMLRYIVYQEKLMA